MAQPNENKENDKPELAFHERNLRTSVLSLLCQEGGMPRALLSEKLRATPAMMTRCIQRLQAEGLVHNEGRSKGSGGRMCNNVALNPDAGVLVGVEYNQREITTVAVNFAGQLEKQHSFPLPEDARNGAPDKLLPAITNAIQKTFKSAAKTRPLLGIAAVDPGVIDTSTGMTVASNALPEWTQVPIRQKLHDKFRVPVHLSNTTSAILAAVDRLELQRRHADLFYLECRDGISCAIKSNGRQILGSHGMAGELTRCFVSTTAGGEYHPVYVEETFGFSAIRQRLHDAGHPAFQADTPRTDMVQNILSLAAKGDAQVAGILAETWLRLGQMCGSLANMLDPEVIVLDPHFGQADDGSLRAFEQGLKQHMISPHDEQIQTIVSALEEPAAPLGAALTLLDELIFGYGSS
ncbi:MAG: ROK family transcriptional regulator [Verrucomicrobiota bacterium]